MHEPGRSENTKCILLHGQSTKENNISLKSNSIINDEFAHILNRSEFENYSTMNAVNILLITGHLKF